MEHTSQAERMPVIESVWDTVTGRREGRIIPDSPVLFIGRNLQYWENEQVGFHLCPVNEPDRLIPVSQVFKYDNTKILVTVPTLDDGEYHLVAHIKANENEYTYVFPLRFTVSGMTIPEVIMARRLRNNISQIH